MHKRRRRFRSTTGEKQEQEKKQEQGQECVSQEGDYGKDVVKEVEVGRGFAQEFVIEPSTETYGEEEVTAEQDEYTTIVYQDKVEYTTIVYQDKVALPHG